MSLLDPVEVPVYTRESFAYDAATQPTPFGAYLGAKLQTGFDQSISGRITDYLTDPSDGQTDQRRLTEDEWRKLKFDRTGLAFREGQTIEQARRYTVAFDERRYHDSLIDRYKGGLLGQVAGFGAQMLGGLPSPENFIPIIGPGVRAAMVARLGVIGGHIAAGAADAAIGNLAADAITFPDLNRRGEDLGVEDLALDLGLGALTGGLFGAGGGVLARRRQMRDVANAVRLDGLQRQADALEIATQAVTRDEPVDVGAVLADVVAPGSAVRRRLAAQEQFRQQLLGGAAAPEDARAFDVSGLPEREEPHASVRRADVGVDEFRRISGAAKQEQPFDSMDGLYAVAPERQKDLAAAGAEIEAAVPGVKFKNPGVKERATAEEKIGRKGYASPKEMTDVVRGGFVVRTPDEAEAVVAELSKRYRVLDEGFTTTPGGYFDGKLSVQFADGTVGEVQLLEPNLPDAKSKGGGHKLYTEARSLPAGDPRRAELRRQMNDLYAAARSKAAPEWEAALGRGPAAASSLANADRHSPSDMTRPELNTSSSSTLAQDPRNTANASSSLTSTAGRSSQSVNTGAGIGPSPVASNMAAGGQGGNDIRETVRQFVADAVTRERAPDPPASLATAEQRVKSPPKDAAAEARQQAEDLGVGDPKALAQRLIAEEQAKLKAAETGAQPAAPKKLAELDDIAEMQDVRALERAGALTEGDMRALTEADDLMKRADGWADAYSILSSCALRFGA